eukprot:SAG31_NODE_35_length_31836_cov_10.841352_15_plen_106_part_00
MLARRRQLDMGERAAAAAPPPCCAAHDLSFLFFLRPPAICVGDKYIYLVILYDLSRLAWCAVLEPCYDMAEVPRCSKDLADSVVLRGEPAPRRATPARRVADLRG